MKVTILLEVGMMGTFATPTNNSRYAAAHRLTAVFPDPYAAEAAASALREMAFEVDTFGGTADKPLLSDRTKNALLAGACLGLIVGLILPMTVGIGLDASQLVMLLFLSIPGGMAIGGFIASDRNRPLSIRERALERESYRQESRMPGVFLTVTAPDGIDIAEADEVLRQTGATDITPAT